MGVWGWFSSVGFSGIFGAIREGVPSLLRLTGEVYWKAFYYLRGCTSVPWRRAGSLLAGAYGHSLTRFSAHSKEIRPGLSITRCVAFCLFGQAPRRYNSNKITVLYLLQALVTIVADSNDVQSTVRVFGSHTGGIKSDEILVGCVKETPDRPVLSIGNTAKSRRDRGKNA